MNLPDQGFRIAKVRAHIRGCMCQHLTFHQDVVRPVRLLVCHCTMGHTVSNRSALTHNAMHVVYYAKENYKPIPSIPSFDTHKPHFPYAGDIERVCGRG